MMKIEFKTGNAAFEENLYYEVRKILDEIGDNIYYGRTSGAIVDTNGNTIGEWSVD